MALREGVTTLSMDGTSNRGRLPGLGEDEARHVYYYAVLPSMLLNLHLDYMLTSTIWPLAVDRSDVVCEWHSTATRCGSPTSTPAGPSSSGT